MEKEELKKIIEKHESWLDGEGGEKADLRGANLREADLRGANLRGADLRWANLCEADLRGANLLEADLRWANLREADLRWADLREADLREANLREADLSWADLSWANLREADLREANLDFSCWPLWCGSLRTKADSKIVIQLLYHTMRLAENSETDEELKNALFTKELIAQANRFHRVEECGKIKEEE